MEMSGGQVTMKEDELSYQLTIPKHKSKIAKIEPERYQEPFAPAVSFAKTAFGCGLFCVIFCTILIPLNAIHLYEGQFFFLMIATGATVVLTITAKEVLLQILKDHCEPPVDQDGKDPQKTQTNAYRTQAVAQHHQGRESPLLPFQGGQARNGGYESVPLN
jgi:hypothetical protein